MLLLGSNGFGQESTEQSDIESCISAGPRKDDSERYGNGCYLFVAVKPCVYHKDSKLLVFFPRELPSSSKLASTQQIFSSSHACRLYPDVEKASYAAERCSDSPPYSSMTSTSGDRT